LKTFRTLKYRALTKNSPGGRTYIFTRDSDLTATYRGTFYQEDEDWMMELTSKMAGELLVWTNMPEELKAVIAEETGPSRVIKVSDIYGTPSGEDPHNHRVGKTRAQVDAEVMLANLQAERDRENAPKLKQALTDLEVLEEKYDNLQEAYLVLERKLQDKEAVIADLKSELDSYTMDTKREPEEVLVTSEIEESETTPLLAVFKEAHAKIPNIDKFVREMKLEFSVADLTKIAAELGMEYEGTKAEMIKQMVEHLF
jgi:hypothetical protein